MTKTLKIDFVSDVACPWCVIGLGGLTKALERLDGEVAADIHFQPFELNPDMPPGGANHLDYITSKYGSSREQALANGRAIAERAANLDFTMVRNEDSRVYNTFDAHRLLHWAGLKGGQLTLKRALFEVNFTQGRDTGDPEVLVQAAVAAGLDGDEAREVLASGRYADEVRAAEDHWRRAGISSVPAVIVNDKYLISGGQPPEAFEQALRNIAAEV
jgi:predicted DsbA family dithiol-disulfide isomerase